MYFIELVYYKQSYVGFKIKYPTQLVTSALCTTRPFYRRKVMPHSRQQCFRRGMDMHKSFFVSSMRYSSVCDDMCIFGMTIRFCQWQNIRSGTTVLNIVRRYMSSVQQLPLICLGCIQKHYIFQGHIHRVTYFSKSHNFLKDLQQFTFFEKRAKSRGGNFGLNLW